MNFSFGIRACDTLCVTDVVGIRTKQVVIVMQSAGQLAAAANQSQTRGIPGILHRHGMMWWQGVQVF